MKIRRLKGWRSESALVKAPMNGTFASLKMGIAALLVGVPT